MSEQEPGAPSRAMIERAPEKALARAGARDHLVVRAGSIPGALARAFGNLFMVACLSIIGVFTLMQLMLAPAGMTLEALIWIPLVGLMGGFYWAVPMFCIMTLTQWFKTRHIEHDAPAERLTTRHIKRVTIPVAPHTDMRELLLATLPTIAKKVTISPSSTPNSVEAVVSQRLLQGKIEVGARVLHQSAHQAELLVWAMPKQRVALYDNGKSRMMMNALVKALTAHARLPPKLLAKATS